MTMRKVAAGILLALLILACAAPLLLLAHSASSALRAPTPRLVRFRDGSTMLGQILPTRGSERRDGLVRLLRGDATPGPAALLVPATAIASTSPAPEAWVLERDDGPMLFGYPRRMSSPGWLEESPESVTTRLRTLPDRLRNERERLVEAIRSVRDDSARFASMSDEWSRWVSRDDSTILELDRGDGTSLQVRVSGIAQAWPSGEAGFGLLARRSLRFVVAPPGAWGGGGIGPALASILNLALMSGLLAGFFGLSAAVWIHGRGLGEAWLVRGRALVSNLAGVPGVVWGVAGAGLLIHGLGPLVDRWTGATRWGGGGLLWSGVTLGALASPIVMALALEELDRLPHRWKEIAWTSGATKLQILHRVILPSAWKGLLAAVLSGMARAIGETAPLLLTGAVHAYSGLSLGSEHLFPSLAGGFLHPGVLALDSPWIGVDLERGQPMVSLMLLLLALLCIGLDLSASRLRRRPVATGEEP